MTRVNIQLPEELHKKIKVVCAIKEKTIKTLVEEVLKKELREKSV